MRRFKLVRVNRRKVEVQKVKLKINYGTLLIAFLFACLVWLYVAGSDLQKNIPPEPMDTTAAATDTHAETQGAVGPAEDVTVTDIVTVTDTVTGVAV